MESEKHASNHPTRLFVGGVVEPITVDSLSAYLARFGHLESCEIMTNPVTYKSKGFAFVTYKRIEDSEKAINHRGYHIVDGIRIEIKKSFSRVESQHQQKASTPRKIFVDNIPLSVDEENIEEFFSKFGAIEEIYYMPKPSNRRQAYAFIVFEDEMVAKILLNYQTLKYEGGSLRIRRPLPKKDFNSYEAELHSKKSNEPVIHTKLSRNRRKKKTIKAQEPLVNQRDQPTFLMSSYQMSADTQNPTESYPTNFNRTKLDIPHTGILSCPDIRENKVKSAIKQPFVQQSSDCYDNFSYHDYQPSRYSAPPNVSYSKQLKAKSNLNNYENKVFTGYPQESEHDNYVFNRRKDKLNFRFENL